MPGMPNYIIGANILENLTTGMYIDSKVIYREYIQNSCDQIDKAYQVGLLKPKEGVIEIWIDIERRKITIEDNATGIPASSFCRTLGNIADSDKKIGEDKGFRGIGRLCGLGYCGELVFSSSVKGEGIISIMRCDAKKMRTLIQESQSGKKFTANDVLHAINRFEEVSTDNIESHYFRVEINDIKLDNTELLDFKEVKNYLSFVAPVPYQNSFYYRGDVYKEAENVGVKIDEYNITLNGEQVFKRYSTVLKDPNGKKYDEIFDIHFKQFHDINGNLLAWMWIGLHRFQRAIPKINMMRGLRLRKQNIQIGGEDALQKQNLFKEERGNNYFVGELFAVSKELIPNTQRDYFNENPTRLLFERELKKYFDAVLKKVYYDCSAINSAYNKIGIYENKVAEYKEREDKGAFVNGAHREKELKCIEESKRVAEDAHKKIERVKVKADDLMIKVIHRIEHDQKESIGIDKSFIETIPAIDNNKTKHRTDRLSQYPKGERKLIAKIYEIILSSIDSETAEKIISKIEEGLQ